MTDKNPDGTITNSNLEILGGLLHLKALTQTFDAQEHTVLSKIGDLNTVLGAEGERDD